ncbi:MAG: transposase [Christensenellales bacterium]
MRRYEVTSTEWEQSKNLFPPERIGKRGCSAKSNRGMLNGMPWIARSGAQWRELPSCYGLWRIVYSRLAADKDAVMVTIMLHLRVYLQE